MDPQSTNQITVFITTTCQECNYAHLYMYILKTSKRRSEIVGLRKYTAELAKPKGGSMRERDPI